jgi:hypothetical protein
MRSAPPRALFVECGHPRSDAVALVTQQEAARVLGISRRTLDRKKDPLMKLGQAVIVGKRLMYETDGLREALGALVDRQPANAQWLAGEGKLAQRAKEETDAAAATGQIPEYGESRAKREHYLARLAELQVASQEQQLMDADEVRRERFETGRRIRNWLMAMAARVAPDLAVMDEPAAISIFMERQMADALTGLADDLRS